MHHRGSTGFPKGSDRFSGRTPSAFPGPTEPVVVLARHQQARRRAHDPRVGAADDLVDDPPEIVLATSVDRKAPTMLRTPLIRTAVLGSSAPVAMEVALAFAVAWNPLVKSKARAVSASGARPVRIVRC